jgi:hypothetical protein
LREPAPGTRRFAAGKPVQKRAGGFRGWIGPGFWLRPKATITPHCKRFEASLQRFRAKWTPVRVKKTRKIKRLEPRSDFIGTDKGLVESADEIPVIAVAMPID